ncbi:MAG: hypothetical protein L3J06_08230 [Cyclobacteriaceae bacterium]|nr:hypothetical protein [Cyclobacteriaceae bacterium]
MSMVLGIMMMLSLFNSNKKGFVEITDSLSIQKFEHIKNFILNKGDRRFYRNYDNNNPHYDFSTFHVYLNAEIGQKNLYNDPEVSDFNEITIYDSGAEIQYYTIRIVRKGDIENKEILVNRGMKENNVYLMDTYKDGLGKMEKNLLEIYLPKIRSVVK